MSSFSCLPLNTVEIQSELLSQLNLDVGKMINLELLNSKLDTEQTGVKISQISNIFYINITIPSLASAAMSSKYTQIKHITICKD